MNEKYVAAKQELLAGNEKVWACCMAHAHVALPALLHFKVLAALL